jgi:hypothetical protein
MSVAGISRCTISPASAATAPLATQVFRFHGTTAEALWDSTSATSFIRSQVVVSQTRDGQDLLVRVLDQKFGDPPGTVTLTQVILESGFSFTIDRLTLSTAHVSGSELPALVCTFIDFGLVDCSDTTIDLDITWTGFGDISHEVTTENELFFELRQIVHINGTTRDATAAGTIGETTVTSEDVLLADIGRLTEGVTCIGVGCSF